MEASGNLLICISVLPNRLTPVLLEKILCRTHVNNYEEINSYWAWGEYGEEGDDCSIYGSALKAGTRNVLTAYIYQTSLAWGDMMDW